MSRTVPLPRSDCRNLALDVVEIRVVGRLKRNPLNPRSEVQRDDPRVIELARSIEETKGPIEPILILPDGSIVAGERRWVACQIANIKRTRVIVRQMSEQEQLVAMMAENVQREDLDPVAEATGYQRLKDTGLSQSEIARRTGVHQIRVGSRLKILSFPEDVQVLFKNCDLPVRAVDPLSKIENPDDLSRIAGMVVSRRLAVPALEKLIEREFGTKKPRRDYERQEKPNKERPKGVIRDSLVDNLRSRKSETVTVGRLLDEMEFICCACGQSENAACRAVLCAACPLAAFLNRFANIDTARVPKHDLLSQTAPDRDGGVDAR